jgi:hypothetical protein
MQYVTDNSILQLLLMVVSYVMAEPNMRAIMQNLTATSLWEIGRVACRVFRFRKGIDSGAARVASPQLTDGADGLITVMLAAIASLKDRSGEITIKTQSSKYEKTELTVKLVDGKNPVKSIAMPVANHMTREQRQRSQNLVLFD